MYGLSNLLLQRDSTCEAECLQEEERDSDEDSNSDYDLEDIAKHAKETASGTLVERDDATWQIGPTVRGARAKATPGSAPKSAAKPKSLAATAGAPQSLAATAGSSTTAGAAEAASAEPAVTSTAGAATAPAQPADPAAMLQCIAAALAYPKALRDDSSMSFSDGDTSLSPTSPADGLLNEVFGRRSREPPPLT